MHTTYTRAVIGLAMLAGLCVGDVAHGQQAARGTQDLPAAAPATRPTTVPFQKEIEAFEAAERRSPSPTGAVVFVGSSSIRLWKTLKQDFPEHTVVNRGFGGSQIAHSVMHFDRFILPLKPKRIVFYAGENDLNAGKSPEQVAADFKAFVGLVHRHWPEVKIDYISMKPSPSRWKMVERFREGNRLIEAFTKTDPRLSFIDVWPGMLGPDGKPREELFVKDMLHMNEKGYEIWTGLVGARLREKP